MSKALLTLPTASDATLAKETSRLLAPRVRSSAPLCFDGCPKSRILVCCPVGTKASYSKPRFTETWIATLSGMLGKFRFADQPLS